MDLKLYRGLLGNNICGKKLVLPAHANIRQTLTWNNDNLSLAPELDSTGSVSLVTANLSNCVHHLTGSPYRAAMWQWHFITLWNSTVLQHSRKELSTGVCVVIPVSLAGGQCTTRFDGEPKERELLTAAVYFRGGDIGVNSGTLGGVNLFWKAMLDRQNSMFYSYVLEIIRFFPSLLLRLRAPCL